jgi:sterol desaturase/sphingolipid hydroxylase (fatty acid hydroxylase superfamily)
MALLWFLLVPAVFFALAERSRYARLFAQPFLRARFADDVGLLLVGWLATAKLSLVWVGAASATLHATAGPIAGWPRWLLVPAAVLFLDLGNYLCHWLMHRVDLLWRFHQVHHSSRKLDWLATFRSHLVEQLLRRALAPVLLVLIGFPLSVIAIAGGVFTAWAIWNHANLRPAPRWLEWVFITPRLHRLHHQPATTERNLGTIFTFWDRLRGTLVDGRASEELGVPGEVTSYPQGFLPLLREPFRRLRAPVALLALGVFVGCATTTKSARPPSATWQLSGDVPLPRGP